MRVLFMGSPEFSIPILDALYKNFHLIEVYTQPPKQSGRGKKMSLTPVHDRAISLGIPVKTPSSLKNYRGIEGSDIDMIVVAAYGLILPELFLNYPRAGCINVHASLLPRWRGAAPIQRAIMNGDKETGISIMKMDDGLDTGKIASQEKIIITNDSDFKTIHDELSSLGADMIVDAINSVKEGRFNLKDQPEEGVTYANKIAKSEERISFNSTAINVRNHIRGLSPYPCGFIEYRGERIKIIKAQANMSRQGRVGHIIDQDLSIGCKLGVIQPTQVQRMGRKSMDIESFLRGTNLKIGTRVD